MDKPCLVIMAAGMGSRYGGLKQMDPMDEQQHIIMDFSIYDAYEAGFRKVIFIIKEDFAEAFKSTVGARAARYMETAYAYQRLEDLPEGFSVPEGRVKPWGTTHALLSARHLIHGPFAVVNADDYYGKQAFRDQYEFLSSLCEDDKYHYLLSGYMLGNTLTENGYVSRGVCETGEDGRLLAITERVHIEKRGEAAAFTEDGKSWQELGLDVPVSMNLWGLGRDYLDEAWEGFSEFLANIVPANPMKAEYYLPGVVDRLLKEKDAVVKVMKTPDRWYGVTYPEDKPAVTAAIAAMEKAGLYPENF